MSGGINTGGTTQLWPGCYYDGKTSAQHSVTVALTEHGITIHHTDGSPRFWPYEDVRQTQGEHVGEPVRLEYGHPLSQALVIEDAAFLSDLQTLVGHRYRHFRFPVAAPRRIALLTGALLVGLAAVAALVLWGIPAFANLVTPWVPVSWEITLGRTVLAQMVPNEQRCMNEVLQKQVNLLMARLVNPARIPYQLHVTIVDSDVFNAYALPGGEIVLFRPLLEATQSPEELAGVLAHEAEHILLRHTTQSLLRDLSLAALVGAAFGDVTGIGTLAIQAARTLSTLHYSRDMEEQADFEGIELLQRAHFNPAGMIQFFETLKTREGRVDMPAYLSTHPQTEQRISRLKALLHQPAESPPISSDEEWKKTAALCRK